MSFEFPEMRIQIFCKAPIAGTVKTRLISHLGADRAAELHERLARRIIGECQAADLAPLELWCAPDSHHEFFGSVTNKRTTLHQQHGIDLGERMLTGARYAIEEEKAEAVVIVGTDCPTLDEDYLRLALQRLQAHGAVIGPAKDGGYGLIGLKAADPSVFAGIEWGTNTVCAETCRAFNKAGLNWSLLPLLWDIDTPEDLKRGLTPF